jgi:hypothetical protein
MAGGSNYTQEAVQAKFLKITVSTIKMTVFFSTEILTIELSVSKFNQDRHTRLD